MKTTLAVLAVIGVLHLLRITCSIGKGIEEGITEGLKIIRGGK